MAKVALTDYLCIGGPFAQEWLKLSSPSTLSITVRKDKGDYVKLYQGRYIQHPTHGNWLQWQSSLKNN